MRLKNVKTGAVTERAVDGVFIAIGHSPATELFVGQLEMKPRGYIVTDGRFHRDLGARRVCRRRRDRRHLPAGGDGRRQGCMAALEAERFLAAQAKTAGGGGIMP